MLLFVGLGNPGRTLRRQPPQYRFHGGAGGRQTPRHRAVAAEILRAWRWKARSAAEKLLLLLPGTFMNESGRAVAEAAHFYKLEAGSVVVFHDEAELPPGKVRVKIGGGNAGHNGLRSITEHIGNDYRRVRLGVGHPGNKDLMEAYVLQDFAKSERPWVEALCEIVADNVALLIEGKDSTFQNKVHLAMAAKGFGGGEEPEDSE